MLCKKEMDVSNIIYFLFYLVDIKVSFQHRISLLLSRDISPFTFPNGQEMFKWICFNLCSVCLRVASCHIQYNLMRWKIPLLYLASFHNFIRDATQMGKYIYNYQAHDMTKSIQIKQWTIIFLLYTTYIIQFAKY